MTIIINHLNLHRLNRNLLEVNTAVKHIHQFADITLPHPVLNAILGGIHHIVQESRRRILVFLETILFHLADS